MHETKLAGCTFSAAKKSCSETNSSRQPLAPDFWEVYVAFKAFFLEARKNMKGDVCSFLLNITIVGGFNPSEKY